MKEKKAIKESESASISTQATPSGQPTDVGGLEVKKGYNTWKLVIFGLAFMAPALSLMATFPLVLVAGFTWMGIPLAYLIAGVSAIITAVAFSQLVRAYPKSGSVWAFAQGAVGAKFGQFAVWIYLLEILVVPAAALIPAGFFLQSWLGVPPWVTIIVFVAVVSLLAISGTRTSVGSMAVLFLIQVGILIAFAVSAIMWSINTGNFSSMAIQAVTPNASLFGISGITAGATVAIFSFLGYEAPASVTGEAENPKRSVYWGIIGSALIATALYFFLAWAFVLAVPSKGLHSLLWYVNPVPAMGDAIWGLGLGNILNFAGVIAGLVCALAGVTASSRVLQKLGEDQIIPKAFARVDLKVAAPIVSISLVAIITLVLGNFAPWEVIAYTIASGALPAFIITNLLSFWHYRKELLNPKRLVLNGILPWLGVILSAWFILVGIPAHLKWILVMWVLVGVILVFINAVARPKAFGEERKGVPIGAAIGLVVSIILLILVVFSFGLWLGFYSSGIEWWHIIAPYALNDVVAIAATIGMVVVFAALMGAVLLRSKIGGKSGETKS